jgi:hypothetical protein
MDNNQTLSVPPPFNNCPPCDLCGTPVQWGFIQQIAVASTASLIVGILATLLPPYIIYYCKKIRSTPRIMKFQLDTIPETETKV